MLTGQRDRIVRSGYSTPEYANEALDAALKDANAVTYVKPPTGSARMTVAEFFTEWFAYVHTSTASTTAANYEALARACDPLAWTSTAARDRSSRHRRPL